MHRLRSKSTIYRFRVAALLLCLKCILMPACGVILIYSIIIHDDELTLWAMGLIILTTLMVILQWLIAARTSCPLCLTPVLAVKNCMKHRHARTFLGSHRLRVAMAVLFKNSFRCPYCHEPTALEVRDRFAYRSDSRD